MLRIAEQWHASDVGRQRQGNEDSRYVRAPLFIVADGMGGAQAGEVASDMAIRTFDAGLPGKDTGTPAERLVKAIEGANDAIHERSRTDGRYTGMGTTITATYVEEDAVTLAHVGDSRCYLLRDGDLIRLSRDHSLVAELVERGRLTAEEAEHHPQRSVITRALGPEPSVQVDIDTFPARGGDLFLICSDGLTDMVAEDELRALLNPTPPTALEDIGRRLIDAANEAGGRDNITVILYRLEQVDARGRDAGAGAVAASERDGGLHDEDTAEHEAVGHRTRVMEAVRAEDEREPHAAAVHPAGVSRETSAGPGGPSGRRRKRRRLVTPGKVIVLIVVLGLGFSMWSATRQVFFVGVDEDRGDVVTLYRGLPYDGPFGIELYQPVVRTGVTLAAVPAGRRSTFTDHKLRSQKDARALVLALERGELDQP